MEDFIDPAKSMILIGGGVGPAAGVTLHQKIVDITHATKDADHLKVCHISFSSQVRDRTSFLKSREASRNTNGNGSVGEANRVTGGQGQGQQQQQQVQNQNQQNNVVENAPIDLDGATGDDMINLLNSSASASQSDSDEKSDNKNKLNVQDGKEQHGAMVKNANGDGKPVQYAVRNPGRNMADAVGPFMQAAESLGLNVIVGVPCNTFHAPACFDAFKNGLLQDYSSQSSSLSLCHMLNETRDFLIELRQEQEDGNLKKIGLMSTTGTRSTRIYRELLEPVGFEVLEVQQANQAGVHDAIYNPKWGLKAVSPATPQAIENYEKYAHELIDAGAQALILGCTEIPLAFKHCMEGIFPPTAEDQEAKGAQGKKPALLIDPVLCLARALVLQAAPQKLKEAITQETKGQDNKTKLKHRDGRLSIIPTGENRVKVLAEAPENNKQYAKRMSLIEQQQELEQFGATCMMFGTGDF